MIKFRLKKNKNKKMEKAYGKYYAYPIVNETYNIDKLSEHMSSHNTPFSAGAIKGMLTDAVICIRELTLQGIAVKIDNLAIFSIGIKNKMGAETEEDFTVSKNIEGVKLRARATGDLMSVNLNLDATLKKATYLVGGTSGGNGSGSSAGTGGSNTGGSSTGDSGSDDTQHGSLD